MNINAGFVFVFAALSLWFGIIAINEANYIGEIVQQERCIDGVIYVEWHADKMLYTRFASVKFNPDSTVVTCEVRVTAPKY
jgi:hypothetical protein